MTDSAKHLQTARQAMDLVKTEADLLAWHEAHMNTLDYLHLTEDDARELEDLYQRRAGRFMGVLAG
jgi:hypothetical protein